MPTEEGQAVGTEINLHDIDTNEAIESTPINNIDANDINEIKCLLKQLLEKNGSL